VRVDSAGLGVYDGGRMNETFKNLRNSFFAGLLVVVPVAASVLILLGIFTWVTDFMLPDALRQQMLTPLYRIIVAILFVVFTIFVGRVTRLVAGKRMVSATESLITHVPLLNKTYGFMKEISQTVLSGKKTMFKRVVLVEFPRPGMFTIGFVTNDTGGEIKGKMRETVISVFVPAAPNPTSGILLFIPCGELVDLQMSVAEGMKMVISCGSVEPLYTPKILQPTAPVAR
jgi:uncharacterized membrane protein